MKISKLVIHHSASKAATTKKADLERWHKERGFSQIGYHKVVEANGSIVNGRSESTQGAHAKGANMGTLGVCVVGDFETETPSPAQIKSLVTVLSEWCKTHKLNSTNIYGHYNVPGATTDTSCPGKNMKSQLSIVKQKITQNLKTGK